MSISSAFIFIISFKSSFRMHLQLRPEQSFQYPEIMSSDLWMYYFGDITLVWRILKSNLFWMELWSEWYFHALSLGQSFSTIFFFILTKCIRTSLFWTLVAALDLWSSILFSYKVLKNSWLVATRVLKLLINPS